MKFLFPFFYALVLLVSCWLAHKVYVDVMARKELKEDYAEINRVNYELFNIQLWKEEALSIFQKRILEFNISQGTYDALEVQVNNYLEELYQQYIKSGELIDLILDQLQENGTINKMFLDLIKTNIDQQLEQLDLSSQLPVFGRQIITEIKNSEPFLKSYLQQELLRLVTDDIAQNYVDRRQLIFQKYSFTTLNETDSFLKNRIDELSLSVGKHMIRLISLLGFIILVTILLNKIIGFKTLIVALSGVSVILLVLGVSIPMIDIDARLNSFTFLLMNEPIHFDEQIIYFQSKSILEVTQTLIEGRGIDLKIVGVLVFAFSIIFPFTKLLLSALFLFIERLQKNALVQTIIFHLGKWSMADVFVVAMFMAYIGFYGIISAQLDSISNNRSGFAIETINYSSLSPGAFFFTSYTILSIFIGILMSKKK